MTAITTISAPGRHVGVDPRERYRHIRELTLRLAEPLSAEDAAAQSMPQASPAKWHLAHTSWFFEEFLLAPHVPRYRPFHADFGFLFNSYYNAVGPRIDRARRGLITRPSLEQVLDYRRAVDEQMEKLLDKRPDLAAGEVLEIGLNHEQQHQELLLTDIKHLLSCNPLRPAYCLDLAPAPSTPSSLGWVPFDEGVRRVGYDGDGFAYDNERPAHRVFAEAFELADRLVTNGEYLTFIGAGGYAEPALWLDDGWSAVQSERWTAPLYWVREDTWCEFTLGGGVDLDPAAPVCHLSFYEADAYARWRGARLPTEFEWEIACGALPIRGNLLETDLLHPASAPPAETVRQAFGDAWEWTRSDYAPYPGYTPPPGALGEYNGKFMSNQYVLRGGSCFTPASHIRPTYRNFFPAATRWQCAGIRLARGAS